MPVQHRAYFELGVAAELTRRLRGTQAAPTVAGRAAAPSPTALAPEPQPAPPAPAPAPAAVAGSSGLGTFHTPEARYAEELWEALLRWLKEGLDAEGVFAMDQHGFSIAGVGSEPFVPPEVMLAAFTSMTQLLDAYLGEGQPVRKVEFTAEDRSPMALFHFSWTGQTILVGVSGGRRLGAEEFAGVAAVMERELEAFSVKRNQAEGDVG